MNLSRFVVFCGLSTFVFSNSAAADVHLGLFGGAALLEGGAKPAFGVDAFFPMGESLSLGVFYDATLSKPTMHLAGVLVMVPVYGGLKVIAGPALERAGSHNAAAVRAGALYEFHLSETLSLAPTVNADYASGHVVVVPGVTLGAGIH